MKAICKDFPYTMMFLGPSGSGKDTQMEKLSELCGYEIIGTGDMFRVLHEEGVDGSEEAYQDVVKGVWVKDEVVYELFPKWLERFDAKKPWLFSQTVRTIPQVAMFDDLLSKYSRKLERVVYLSLSDEVAVERMSLRRICPKCSADYHLKFKKPKNDELCDNDGEKLITRDDDKPEAILSRIREFRVKTQPILDVYKKRGILTEVDAAPSIEEIHVELVKILSKNA